MQVLPHAVGCERGIEGIYGASKEVDFQGKIHPGIQPRLCPVQKMITTVERERFVIARPTRVSAVRAFAVAVFGLTPHCHIVRHSGMTRSRREERSQS